MRIDIEDLPPELQEKAKACQTVEELFELAKEEGVELSEQQLEAMAGGVSGWGVPDTCPNDTTPPLDIGGIHFV